MRIDPEVSVHDLIRTFKNGNITDTLNALEGDHPGLTAMVFYVGATERSLTAQDCNTIQRLLMERRKEALYKQDDEDQKKSIAIHAKKPKK